MEAAGIGVARGLRARVDFARARAVHVVVAIELTTILALGLLTVFAYPIWSPVDEEPHFAYVQTVAEQQRLPVLFQDTVSLATHRLGSQTALGFYRTIHGRPIQYEAFQPPLYYLAAAPVYAVAPGGQAKVSALRLFDLALLFGAIAVLWRMAACVLPERRTLAFAFGLTVFLWPGVIVRSVNISNAALELLLGLAFIHVLWRADAERDGRRLLGAGVLLGLGLLTKTTLVYLAPLLVVVAARHAWHGRSRRWRPLATALVTLALPLALMAPWFAFNELQFGTLTTNAQARDQQRFDSYGRKYHYTANLAKRDLPLLLNPFEPQEWQYQTGLSHPALFTGFDFLRVSLFGAPLLLLLAAPRWLRSRHTALLLVPWLLAVVLLAVSSVGANWSIMLPRYTYPVLPGIALYGAVAWRRLGREERVPLAVLSATLVVLAATWVYAASDFLL